ncbi:reverse transcriptase domain-containing protein, partial [Tanacetum coccineum]
MECKTGLIGILRKHADAFTWTPTDITGIPHFIAEHKPKTYPHIEPKVQRKRSIAPNRRKVVKKEVAEWLKAEIVKRMAKKDEEKTALHTDKGVFCCTKMAFRLKNVSKIYQRPVNTIFEGQMGRNLEAYVDDMVIKSKMELDIIKDIEETLLILKKVNMKLNPKKCSFIIEEGQFLGYIVTSEGIRANPEKTKAVMNMPSPSSLKQMQRLSANEAINVVLLVERNRRQISIHYVSRALQGAEINYLSMEKFALALVHAARRLR